MPPKSMDRVADIETFIDDFVSGKVKPVLKSEEVQLIMTVRMSRY